MNKLFFGIIIVLSSQAFAGPALKAERVRLCNQVNQELENSNADMALDEAKCVRNRLIRSTSNHEGFLTISGPLKFNFPGGKMTLKCSVTYIGAEMIKGSLFCK